MSDGRRARWPRLLVLAVGTVSCGAPTSSPPLAARRTLPTAPRNAIADGGGTTADAKTRAELLARAPVVLTGDHAPRGSTWLPNGHLAIFTAREVLEINPEDPNAAWKVRPPLSEKVPLAIAGSGGADRFLMLDADGVGLWEASSWRQIANVTKLASVSPLTDRFGDVQMAISPDGSRGAVILDDASAGESQSTLVFDTQNGREIAKLRHVTRTGERSSEEITVAGEVALSNDGSLVVLKSADTCAAFEVASGRRLVVRPVPRAVSRVSGDSVDVCTVQGQRIWISSQRGFEIFDATNGHLLSRTRDPRLMTASMVTLRDDGSALAIVGYGADGEPRDYSWDGKNVVRVARDPDSNADSTWRFEPRVLRRTDGHFSTRGDGSGLLLEDAAGAVKLRFGQARGTALTDDRKIEVFAGVVREHADGDDARQHDVAFAQGPARLPPIPVERRDSRSAQSLTHFFTVVSQEGKTELVVFDAAAREVARLPVPALARLDKVSGSVALLATHDALWRCDLSSCVEMAHPYFWISSFADPWVVTRPARLEADGLVNLRTGETRAAPAACNLPILIGPAPDLLCASADGFSRVDGATLRPLTILGRRGHAMLEGVLDGHLYLSLARDDFGLDRDLRYDLRRDRSAQMYVSDDAAFVQFDDGEIERFADPDHAAESLRCQIDGGWTSFASCAAQWETRGRFEDPSQ